MKLTAISNKANSTAHAKQISTAFGLLSHLAKPATTPNIKQAKRAYLQKRYAEKLAG